MKILEKLHHLLPDKKWRLKNGYFVMYQRYVVSLKFLSSVTFQELLNQFEDEIHSEQDEKIMLPCSTQLFEKILNLTNLK